MTTAGTTESVISGYPRTKSSPTTIRSAASASAAPAPRAAPVTAAITGVDMRGSRVSSRVSSCARMTIRWCASAWPTNSLRSPPAQKMRPCPATTTARTSSSRSAVSRASMSSRSRAVSRALRCLGRWRVRIRTTPTVIARSSVNKSLGSGIETCSGRDDMCRPPGCAWLGLTKRGNRTKCEIGCGVSIVRRQALSGTQNGRGDSVHVETHSGAGAGEADGKGDASVGNHNGAGNAVKLRVHFSPTATDACGTDYFQLREDAGSFLRVRVYPVEVVVSAAGIHEREKDLPAAAGPHGSAFVDRRRGADDLMRFDEVNVDNGVARQGGQERGFVPAVGQLLQGMTKGGGDLLTADG